MSESAFMLVNSQCICTILSCGEIYCGVSETATPYNTHYICLTVVGNGACRRSVDCCIALSAKIPCGVSEIATPYDTK